MYSHTVHTCNATPSLVDLAIKVQTFSLALRSLDPRRGYQLYGMSLGICVSMYVMLRDIHAMRSVEREGTKGGTNGAPNSWWVGWVGGWADEPAAFPASLYCGIYTPIIIIVSRVLLTAPYMPLGRNCRPGRLCDVLC